MAEKIPFWKSNSFFKTFVLKDGDDGCTICEAEKSA